MRFLPNVFIHLIKLTNKYGEEPRNLRIAMEEIRRGAIQFDVGRYDVQRAKELSWASLVATQPDFICENWQALGRGNEAFVKNFGIPDDSEFRVLICVVRGKLREVVTLFPRKKIGERELATKIWP